jgi:hypothetical protein
MAMYLLAKTQPESFQKVLDWTVQHDPYPLNQKMAQTLGGKMPEPVIEDFDEKESEIGE